MVLFPALKRRLQAGIPDDLRAQLAHVTPLQLEAVGLLLQLRDHARGASMHEVARMHGCALSTATSLADRLIRQGLAERIGDVDDRRVVKIVPTERGVELLEKFLESRRRLVLDALAPLDDDEVAKLVTLLGKVANAGIGREEVTRG